MFGKGRIPHIMLAQQIIPDKFDVSAIGNGHLPAAPQKRGSNRVYRSSLA
jgi:hypothetical protein